MATKRGFVQKIEVGRAGLAKIVLIHDVGSTGIYVIKDLDADPERFNERLSMLGLMRDAMNRAEPVEIEFSASDGGQVIDRAVRIARDALEPSGATLALTGLVADVVVYSENGIASGAEKRDGALISLIATDLSLHECVLDLQAPERLVAKAQLEILSAARASGVAVAILVDSSTGSRARIIAVSPDAAIGDFGRDEGKTLDGFVESLSLLPAGGFASKTAATFASIRFTSAPPFTGPGNILALTPFTPTTIELLVTKGSATYDLFEAGLRDNLRMRVLGIPRENRPGDRGDKPRANTAEKAGSHLYASVDTAAAGPVGLALAAELLAPLASASRPVWVHISRESLDHGPEGFRCTTGMPTSDLAPMSLRDLKIPYPAAWTGAGCFNEGVYRFQVSVGTDFELLVDCKTLCLYDADVAGVKLAYACLGGHHEVLIKLARWTCDMDLQLDVYRVR